MFRGNFSNRAALGRLALLLLTALLLGGAGQLAPASASERTLTIYNIHTKVTTSVTFKRDGEYIPEGLEKLNHVMRDWRQNEPTEMDPELLDLIWALHRDLGSNEPVHLISGYRSEKTNNMLRKTRGGQAKKSQHILGKAADIHFPDVPLKKMRNSALVREVGGVGYYPTSGIPFVHVDTGRVRSWPRLPRMELAALFPEGTSQHVPTDGRPITLADARRAAESGKYAGPPEPVMVATREVKPKPAARSVQTAGLGSDALGAFMRITGSIPEPVAPPPSYRGSAMQLASARPAAKIPTTFPTDADIMAAMRANMPAPEPGHDEEHPEELYYAPIAVLPLMNDTPLSRDTGAIALIAPEFDNMDYLLLEPARKLAARMKPRNRPLQLAAAWRFTGPAVRDLTTPRAAPTPPREIITASTPAPSVPMGGPIGYSGGVGMGLR